MKLLIILAVIAVFFLNFSRAQPDCDYKVEVIVNGTEFSAEGFSFKMKATKILGTSANITGTAEIIDENGKTVKRYRPWANESISKQKTSNPYSPNLKPGSYKIISMIGIDCNDLDKGNNQDIRLIKINPEASDEIQKQQIHQNPVTPADIISDAKAPVPNEVKNNTEIKPLQIQKNETNNPDAQFDNEIALAANKPEAKQAEISADAVKEPEIVYESSNMKSKSLVIFFLLALSIMLNVILIWKR